MNPDPEGANGEAAVAAASGRAGDARWAWVCFGAVLVAALLPFRDALGTPSTTLLGTSIDSVHHAWGLWYAARGEPTDALWPAGVVGTVAGGPSLLAGVLATAVVGPVAAYTLTCALQVLLTVGGVGLLAARLAGPWAAPAAAALMLCGRPLYAKFAWGVPEGAALGWLLLALATPRGRDVRRDAALGGLSGALLAASLMENPYTLPILVAGGLAVGARRARKRAWTRLGGELAGGVLALGLWAAFAYGGEGSLAPAALGTTHEVFGRAYVAEGRDGRAHAAAFLASWIPLRYEGARLSAILETGTADVLGWLPALLAGAAVLRAARAARLLVACAGALLLLALGSFPFGEAAGMPGPFLYLNLILGELGRPLTQPVRYLVPAGAALALAGGAIVGAWARGGRARLVGLVLAAAGLEAALAGGLSRALPTYDLSRWACVAGLAPGPVTTRVNADPFESGGAVALMLQMLHEQPGTHRAIGGWAARGERPQLLEQALEALSATPNPSGPALNALDHSGVRWLLLDDARVGRLPVFARCGGLNVVEVAAVTGPANAPAAARAPGATGAGVPATAPPLEAFGAGDPRAAGRGEGGTPPVGDGPIPEGPPPPGTPGAPRPP